MAKALNPQPQDANARLAALDLTAEALLFAVRAGVAARRTATTNHPKSYPGWRDFGERVAALRERLAPSGWTADEPDGVPRTVHPAHKLALITALGNAGTGTAAPVSNRRKRGEATEKVIQANCLQLELQLQLHAPSEPALQVIQMPTWVLLVYAAGEEVRSELSLPKHMDDEGFIDEWLERIPLPVVRVNEVLGDGPDEDDGGGVDFDLPEL